MTNSSAKDVPPGLNFFMFVAFSVKMLSNCRTYLPMWLALPLRNPELSNYLDIASVNSLMPKYSFSVFDEFLPGSDVV